MKQLLINSHNDDDDCCFFIYLLCFVFFSFVDFSFLEIISVPNSFRFQCVLHVWEVVESKKKTSNAIRIENEFRMRQAEMCELHSIECDGGRAYRMILQFIYDAFGPHHVVDVVLCFDFQFGNSCVQSLSTD